MVSDLLGIQTWIVNLYNYVDMCNWYAFLFYVYNLYIQYTIMWNMFYLYTEMDHINKLMCVNITLHMQDCALHIDTHL